MKLTEEFQKLSTEEKEKVKEDKINATRKKAISLYKQAMKLKNDIYIIDLKNNHKFAESWHYIKMQMIEKDIPNYINSAINHLKGAKRMENMFVEDAMFYRPDIDIDQRKIIFIMSSFH